LNFEVATFETIAHTADMKTIADYRRHADECRELARRARSPEEREMILNMAATRDDLAKTRERKITKEHSLPTSREK
jgi:hypothetical protein